MREGYFPELTVKSNLTGTQITIPPIPCSIEEGKLCEEIFKQMQNPEAFKQNTPSWESKLCNKGLFMIEEAIKNFETFYRRMQSEGNMDSMEYFAKMGGRIILKDADIKSKSESSNSVNGFGASGFYKPKKNEKGEWIPTVELNSSHSFGQNVLAHELFHAADLHQGQSITDSKLFDLALFLSEFDKSNPSRVKDYFNTVNFNYPPEYYNIEMLGQVMGRAKGDSGQTPAIQKIQELANLYVKAKSDGDIEMLDYLNNSINNFSDKDKLTQAIDIVRQRKKAEFKEKGCVQISPDNDIRLSNLAQALSPTRKKFDLFLQDVLDNRPAEKKINRDFEPETYQQSTSEIKYENFYEDPLWEKYTELTNPEIESSKLLDPRKNASQMWDLAKHFESKYPEQEVGRNWCAERVALTDPSFNSSEVMLLINENSRNGYDETSRMYQAANAVERLVEANPDLSDRGLMILDRLTKESLSNRSGEDALDKATLQSNLIDAYGKCEYSSPKKAENALSNISELNANIQDKSNPYLNEKQLETIQNILYQHPDDKDVCQKAFDAIKNISSNTNDPKSAEKIMSLYDTISQGNPEMAELCLSSTQSIYKRFENDEKVQGSCQKFADNLTTSSKYDEDTLRKANGFSKKWSQEIKAEQLKKLSGQKTRYDTAKQVKETTLSNEVMQERMASVFGK